MHVHPKYICICSNKIATEMHREDWCLDKFTSFYARKKKSLKWCALLLWIILFKCIRLYLIYFCVFFTQYSQICKFIQEKLDAACKWNAYKILSLVSKHQNYSYIDFEFEGWAHFLTCTDLVWSDHPSLLSTMYTP